MTHVVLAVYEQLEVVIDILDSICHCEKFKDEHNTGGEEYNREQYSHNYHKHYKTGGWYSQVLY